MTNGTTEARCEHGRYAYFANLEKTYCQRCREDVDQIIAAQRAEIARLTDELDAVKAHHDELLGDYRVKAASLQLQFKENDALRALLEAAKVDAGRYRSIRDLKCLSFAIEKDQHKCFYESAEEYLGRDDGLCPDEDREAMIAANTVWVIQIYWNTPVGFELVRAATLDAAIDATMKEQNDANT